MEFSEWITNKYVEWRGDAIGRNRSVSEFAEYIGVKQQAMSSWMNGITPKRHETITRLAAQLGPEVYDVLGIDRPPQADPIYDELHKIFHQMTADQRARYLEDGYDILAEDKSP